MLTSAATDNEANGPAGNDPVAGSDNVARPSELEKSEMLRVFKAWYKADDKHSSGWRTQAKVDFDIVAGDQWTEKDQGILKDQNRTPITFNRSLTIIKAIAGMEINGRHEIAYLPRKLEDSALDETLTGASKWMADECDGEDEESEAFENAVICGMGWAEHRLSYDEEPEGKYIEESLDPLEMRWDRTAKKKNLVDARRMERVKTMPLNEAQRLFPGKNTAQLDAKWALGNEPKTPQKTLEERRIRDENSSGPLDDEDEVTIVEIQWWEYEDCWCVADPATNKMLKIDAATYSKLKGRHAEIEALKAASIPDYRQQPLTAAKVQRKVFKRAFVGAEVLDVDCPPTGPERFSWTCITGQRHHNRRTWFGLIRTLRDPQMWSNKLYSQVLHILNSTAKGGVLAETDVFEDQRQAEANWARPDGIVWARPGKIHNANGNPKVIPKPGRGDPSAYVELLGLAINAARDVTGINLELLGQKDVNQPGILEAMRKQAGMTVLATMFDALRRMRKIVGRIRLYFIQNFLSDGRLIRILGKDGAKSIRLVREKTIGEYDVVVDDTPTSPNQKQANWAIISGLLPAFKDQLMARPEVFLKILDYSPLPTQMVEAIRQMILQPQNNPQAQQLQQLQVAGAVAKISKDQAQAELFNKQAGATEATAMYDVAMAKNLLLKHQGDMVAALNEARKSGLDAAKTAAETDHLQAKTETERAKAQTERANAGHVQARTAGEHASALNTHIGSLIDAMTPIEHGPPSEVMPKPQPAMAQ
jgi:hypothetical protein